ncbi:hypothetical protein CORC01_01792 [Colletotrichum orchidophilum]|uniref:Zn(2)-C6 fungal-type domain-containing protein n=1 Tax=Colletotrichum orchidophilum TaxID=1209926 RepID=A0A1G4BNQ2_9PEZI|nr:uncharacterized protein CORC01_01792 [Colletotrichum orchidophilum]OHF03034.1 hypothetical protein CORC01_01792 [Colletotrichum orchidophilum]
MAATERTSAEEPPPADSGPAPKRRKLRKGTQSCWECKRRKARCTFSPATQDVCDGCKRRGSDCVSQAATDLPPPPGGNKHIVDRLGQVEALVRQLLKSGNQNDHPLEDRLVTQAEPHDRVRTHGTTPRRSASPVGPFTATCQSHLSESLNGETQFDDTVIDTPPQESASPERPLVVPTNPGVSNTEGHDAISRKLLAAWPSQEDMAIILAIPVETSQIIRAVICTRSSSNPSLFPSSTALLQLPPTGSHPALIARSLLVLASFLQGMPFPSAHHLEKLSSSWYDIMSRAVKTVHDLVTCKDELVDSLEGLECVMLEGLYENYAGNLRTSWLAGRRGVAIAQMLGLSRGVKPRSLVGSVIEPNDLWFRLVQFDRYLSLMLGLPQSSLNDVYARPDALEGCPALDRFLRLCTVACGRLLQRDPSDIYDYEKAKDIDKLLQEASTVMPAQWWVTPTLASETGHLEKIRETLRFNDHFMYYHLLLQLHFPNVLRPLSECDYVYHRTTAVTASREILSRFLSFRATRPARYYCRGADLIAFLSSTALCLAHICDAPRGATDEKGFHFFAHQRLSDRGMLEQALAVMQELVDQHDDEIATRVATLLKHLLAIENDVASGERYTVAFSPETHLDDDLGYRVKLTHNDTVLNICLPHFWVIKIERQRFDGTPRLIGANLQPLTDRCARDKLATSTEGQGTVVPRAEVKEPGELAQCSTEESWALENLDFTFLDSYIEGSLGMGTETIQ